MDPLRETLKVTRIQYQAELLSKRDEMTGNKRKFGGNKFTAINPHQLSDFSLSPHSKRFEASYCVKVGARREGKETKMEEEGRGGYTVFALFSTFTTNSGGNACYEC